MSLKNEFVGWSEAWEISSHYKNQAATSILTSASLCVAASSVLDMSIGCLESSVGGE